VNEAVSVHRLPVPEGTQPPDVVGTVADRPTLGPDTIAKSLVDLLRTVIVPPNV
jgi:hypothetical protein